MKILPGNDITDSDHSAGIADGVVQVEEHRLGELEGTSELAFAS